MHIHTITLTSLQHQRIEVANEVIWKISCCMKQQEAHLQDDLLMWSAGNVCEGQWRVCSGFMILHRNAKCFYLSFSFHFQCES